MWTWKDFLGTLEEILRNDQPFLLCQTLTWPLNAANSQKPCHFPNSPSRSTSGPLLMNNFSNCLPAILNIQMRSRLDPQLASTLRIPLITDGFLRLNLSSPCVTSQGSHGDSASVARQPRLSWYWGSRTRDHQGSDSVFRLKIVETGIVRRIQSSLVDFNCLSLVPG